ncbi:MAG: hypothetical protein GWO87_03240 [Xanthomonadaceae bacterium]|nr:hypothetical protein [Rhodospirillaceae bacterium]NIA18176.1 hypothetical protein [Xanthomonadaceae bacterium]
MSKQKTKLKKRFTDKKFKFYFYACVTIFFILSVIILYYSFGYKYSIEDKKTVQIGAIVVKTEPKKSEIYINGKLFKNNLLVNLLSDYTKIENLSPKTYNVKVEKNNYFSWEKNIEVEGGYITELKNIVLLKNNYKNKILLNGIIASTGLNNIRVSNDKNKIAYQKIDEEKLNISIFDIKDNKQKIVINPDILSLEKCRDYNFDNIIWSNDDTKIILRVNCDGNYSRYLIDLKNKNRIYKLDAILNPTRKIENGWNFYFDKSLFYLKNDSLYKLDYDKLKSEKIIADISGFSIIGDCVYYFKMGNNNLYSTNYFKSDTPKKIFTMNDNFDSNSSSKIVRSGKNTYFVLSKSGNLYFVNENNKILFINSFIKNAHFSNNDKRIIYSNDHEIWIYYIYEKTFQPSKKEHTNELITRYSGIISNIFLYKDNEHLFYKEGGVFKFIEIDNRDRVNIFSVLKLEGNDIFYSRDNNSIYYAENNKLMQIELDE